MGSQAGLNPMPYYASDGFAINAQGRWLTGGAAQIFYRSKMIEQPIVPTAQWAILAVLIEAAKRAEGENWASGFVTSEALSTKLRRRAGLGDGTLQNLYASVKKLRDRLGAGTAATFASSLGLQWGRDVIEKHRTLGYRLSVSPGNLLLILLDSGND